MSNSFLAAEQALLRKYRGEIDEADNEIQRLQRLRQAMWLAVQGLEHIIRAHGGDPGGDDAETSLPDAAATAPSTRTEVGNVLSAAVAALRRLETFVGAKDLQRVMARGGVVVNYYTLYKNLAREAAREDPVIIRSGDKFGLQEWATNDSETDR